MGKREKFKINREKEMKFLKTKKLLLKIPVESRNVMKETLFPKYGIKSFQEIYDYLILGGLCYMNRSIIEVVDENIEPYIARDKQSKLARIGKAERPEYPEYHQINMQMYPKDFKALKDYLVEKNYAQQWVYEILMREFANENEKVVDFVKRAQSLKLKTRKQQIARLVDDEWIEFLGEDDRMKLLAQFTESYDNKEFNSIFQEEIEKMMQAETIRINEQFELEDEEERAFVETLKAHRRARSARLEELAAPRPEPEKKS